MCMWVLVLLALLLLQGEAAGWTHRTLWQNSETLGRLHSADPLRGRRWPKNTILRRQSPEARERRRGGEQSLADGEGWVFTQDDRRQTATWYDAFMEAPFDDRPGSPAKAYPPTPA
eukprot:SAG22_NODE_493_length_9820_cov_53.085588_4_plen_116_part_00